MKNRIFCLLIFILAGCGFSSGLYKDILQAQEYIEERKYEKAASIYESILLKKPSQNIRIKVNDQLGEIYSVHLNNYEKSIEFFNNIVNESNEPSSQVRSLEKIGKIYFENIKNYSKSGDIYLKLTKIKPALKEQALFRYRYALSIFYSSNYDKAISELRKIVKTNHKQTAVESYYYIGLAYFYKRDWISANENWFEYLKRETRKDKIVKTKFLIANAYESSEKLKEAYNIYYSILGEYPNPEVIKGRLDSLYKRRVSRKR